jgi:predicted nucleotidyltransferase
MKSLQEAPALSAADRDLLVRARDAVRAVEPNAVVILYGSRARGDAAPDSDWDLWY